MCTRFFKTWDDWEEAGNQLIGEQETKETRVGMKDFFP